jgi:Flp pilus assembly CpaF family ATPase
VSNDVLVRRIRQEVSDALAEEVKRAEKEGRPLDPEGQEALASELIVRRLDHLAAERLAAAEPALPIDMEDELRDAVHNALFGLGQLERYLRDPTVENIVANGCDQVWLLRSDGSKERAAPIASSDAELIDILKAAGARMGKSERRFDVAQPELNVRLRDGSRLHAVMDVARRPSVTIRRHRYAKVALEDLVGLGTIDAGLHSFLRAMVLSRRNVAVVGGTNVGKTTFLRGLVNTVPVDERLVVVEDEAELNLSSFPELHEDVVELERREANIEGHGEIDMWQLVRMTLRMAPQRIIVGEVRGGEVVNMLLAMSHGNDGSMCTLHADSSAGAFTKIQMYAGMAQERLPVETIRMLVASSLHFVVHLRQLPDGRRAVSSIREVVGEDGVLIQTNEVYRPGSDLRAVPGDPLSDGSFRRLVAAGFEPSYLDRPEGWWDR